MEKGRFLISTVKHLLQKQIITKGLDNRQWPKKSFPRKVDIKQSVGKINYRHCSVADMWKNMDEFCTF